MTKQDIVIETIKYYSENYRSFIGEQPVFINDEDFTLENLDLKFDAIGRCFLPEIVEELRKHDEFDDLNEQSISNLVKSLEVESLDDLLKAEYRGHDEEFWISLQTLHDEHDNWDSNGLTIKGQEVADDIIRTSFKIGSE